MLRCVKRAGFDVRFLNSPRSRSIRFPVWHAHTCFPILIEPETAPCPSLRMRRQSAFHRIHVHVVQLLDPLLPAPHVEIIETSLPKTPRRLCGRFLPQTQLIRAAPSSRLLPEPARYTLLQDLHHRRRRANLRLRNQKMNVLGHHHVSGHAELVSLPNFAQDFQEEIALARRAQEWPAAVATARNKMQMPLAVTPFQFVTHRIGYTSAPSPPARVRHP